MILSACILFSIVAVSSVYGYVIIGNPDLFSPLSYHIPMVWCDMLAMRLLKEKPVEYITNPLIGILSFSIINHTFGAFAWASYNPGYMYDFGRHIILSLEILVFVGGIFNYVIDRRHKDNDWARVPGILFVESDECD